MTTGADLIVVGQRFRGEPYSTAGGRTSPTSGYKDCSGLVCAVYKVGTGQPCGGTVSTSIETWAVRAGGRYLSRAEALVTPGACAAIWGFGAQGHIGFTTGDGRTYGFDHIIGTRRCYETPSGEGRKVGFSPFDRNGWTRFFTLPGIDYSGAPGAPTPQQRRRKNVLIKIVADGNSVKRDYWITAPPNLVLPSDLHVLHAVAHGWCAMNKLQFDMGVAGQDANGRPVVEPV